MSAQNVETVRRVFAAQGDAEEMAPLLHEDWEHRPIVAGRSVGAVYRGVPDGLRDYLADLAETWERHQVFEEELIDLDDDGVLAILRLEARGRTSGVDLVQRAAIHARFKDGKVWRSTGYTDVDEARRAVGLA
jgi:ketosteroid isomerase-like protein